MKSLLSLLLVLILINTAQVVAQTVSDAGARAPEDYYFVVALGIPVNWYPTNTERALDELAAEDGVSRFATDFEMGVSWPIGDARTLLGPAVRVSADAISSDGASFSFTLGMITASGRRYLTGNAGDGPYVRADLGIASATFTFKRDRVTTSTNGEVGLAVAGGAGWDFPLSSGTSIGIMATAALRNLPGYDPDEPYSDEPFEGGSYFSAIFGASVLW